MKHLRRLPGFRRSPHGLEWRILKRIHLTTLIGTVLPLLFCVAVHLLGLLDTHDFKLMLIFVASLIVLHWTFMMVLGIACFTVMVMKGPAYVADPYHLPDAKDPDDLP